MIKELNMPNYLRDLNDIIPDAPNFSYGELIRSDIAIRNGIQNIPNEEQWKCLEKLAVNILQPVRNQFGRIRITSGYRCVELCEIIGSNKNSNHTKGQAADFEPMRASVTLFDVLRWIHGNLDYRELIAEFFPNGWIHAAYREGGNEKILKLKDKEHNYEIVDLEYIRKIYA
jgi:zinc D-Ala-D-Ala carboxypeptidase